MNNAVYFQESQLHLWYVHSLVIFFTNIAPYIIAYLLLYVCLFSSFMMLYQFLNLFSIEWYVAQL